MLSLVQLQIFGRHAVVNMKQGNAQDLAFATSCIWSQYQKISKKSFLEILAEEVEVMIAVVEGKEAEVEVDLNHIENEVEVDRVVATVDLQDIDIEQLDVQDKKY